MIPIKADSFDDFSHLAKKECGMCYGGVKGPCPANADNRGVQPGAGTWEAPQRSRVLPGLVSGAAARFVSEMKKQREGRRMDEEE